MKCTISTKANMAVRGELLLLYYFLSGLFLLVVDCQVFLDGFEGSPPYGSCEDNTGGELTHRACTGEPLFIFRTDIINFVIDVSPPGGTCGATPDEIYCVQVRRLSYRNSLIL